MIELEAEAVETQLLKAPLLARKNFTGLHRVLNGYESTYQNEVKKRPEAGALRARRQVMKARKAAITASLQCEMERILMCREEGQRLQHDYEQTRHAAQRMQLEFIQWSEQRLAVQKEKQMLRMSGFTLDVLDEVIAAPSLKSQQKRVSNAMVYHLQYYQQRLIADRVMPGEKDLDGLILAASEEPVVLFNALQFLDVLSRREWGKEKGNSEDHHRRVIRCCTPLVAVALAFLNTWERRKKRRIALFLAQTVQTLASLLSIFRVLGMHHETALCNDTSGGGHMSSVLSSKLGPQNLGTNKSNAPSTQQDYNKQSVLLTYEWGEDPVTGQSLSDEAVAHQIILWCRICNYSLQGRDLPSDIRVKVFEKGPLEPQRDAVQPKEQHSDAAADNGSPELQRTAASFDGVDDAHSSDDDNNADKENIFVQEDAFDILHDGVDNPCYVPLHSNKQNYHYPQMTDAVSNATWNELIGGFLPYRQDASISLVPPNEASLESVSQVMVSPDGAIDSPIVRGAEFDERGGDTDDNHLVASNILNAVEVSAVQASQRKDIGMCVDIESTRCHGGKISSADFVERTADSTASYAAAGRITSDTRHVNRDPLKKYDFPFAKVPTRPGLIYYVGNSTSTGYSKDFVSTANSSRTTIDPISYELLDTVPVHHSLSEILHQSTSMRADWSEAAAQLSICSAQIQSTAATSAAAKVLLTEKAREDRILRHVERKVMQAVVALLGPGSDLGTNLLQCCEHLAQILLRSSGRDQSVPKRNDSRKMRVERPPATEKESSVPLFYGTIVHELLLEAIDLGMHFTGRTSVRMGPPSSATAVATPSFRCLDAIDRETAAVLHCATTAVGEALVEERVLHVIQNARNIVLHRSQSFLLVTAWLRSLIAVAVWCIECEELPRETAVEIMRLRGNYRIVRELQTNYSTEVLPPDQRDMLTAKQGRDYYSDFKDSEHRLNRRASFDGDNVRHTSLQNFTEIDIDLSKKVSSNVNLSCNDQQSQDGAVTVASIESESVITMATLPRALDTCFCSREQLMELLSKDTLLIVMALTAVQRHTLSICQLGLLLVRLISRDLFITRSLLEDYFSIPLLSLLLPLHDISSQVKLEKNDSDEDESDLSEDDDNAIDASGMDNSSPASPHPVADDTTIRSGSRPSSQAGSSRPNSRGDCSSRPGSRSIGKREEGAIGTSKSASDFIKSWQRQHALRLMLGEAEAAALLNSNLVLTYADLLQFIGENHVQCHEVMEQLLLLVDHISSWSNLCKYSMIEAGLQLNVQLILGSQTDNVLMIALCELCVEALTM